MMKSEETIMSYKLAIEMVYQDRAFKQEEDADASMTRRRASKRSTTRNGDEEDMDSFKPSKHHDVVYALKP